MQVEIRADKKSMEVRGYVNVVGRDSRVLHDKQGPYIEQIMPGAFAKALKSGGDVELRFDHRKVLGSTGKNDVTLREDQIGLRADAVVTDPDVITAADKQELRGWSFGFIKQKDHWKTDENGTRHRFVDDLELREVSILDKTPAYIATSIETREEGEILIEYRADDLPPGMTTLAEDGVDYVRKSTLDTQSTTTTMTPDDESTMLCVSKTIEIYKMKRRGN